MQPPQLTHVVVVVVNVVVGRRGRRGRRSWSSWSSLVVVGHWCSLVFIGVHWLLVVLLFGVRCCLFLSQVNEMGCECAQITTMPQSAEN